MNKYKIFYKKDATKQEIPEAIYVATTNTDLELESVIIEADNIDNAFEILKGVIENE